MSFYIIKCCRKCALLWIDNSNEKILIIFIICRLCLIIQASCRLRKYRPFRLLSDEFVMLIFKDTIIQSFVYDGESKKWRQVVTIENIFYIIFNSQVSFGHLLTRIELSRRQLHFTWKLTLTCVIGHNYSPTAFWKILLLLIFIVSSYELMLIAQSSTLTTKSEFAIYLLHVCAKKSLI